jgi:hypothetical protein
MALTVGDVLPFAATVKDAAGALANAGTMTLTVTLPDGTAPVGSPFTIAPVGTGLYEKVDLTAASAGRIVGYWLATGANAGAHTQVFHVRSGAETALVSLDEVKDHLNIPLTTTTHDQELERKIGSATAVVERFCGPIVRRTYVERHYGGTGTVGLNRHEVLSLTSVTPIATGGAAVAVADLDPDPDGQITYKDGVTAFPAGKYLWTYVAGRVEIPDNQIEAALVIIKHLWETQRGASSLPLQGGEETFLPAFGFAIPNRAMDLMRITPAPAGVA